MYVSTIDSDASKLPKVPKPFLRRDVAALEEGDEGYVLFTSLAVNRNRNLFVDKQAFVRPHKGSGAFSIKVKSLGDTLYVDLSNAIPEGDIPILADLKTHILVTELDAE